MRHRTPYRGFTLIELLVSAVITALLAGFIVTIVSNVSGFWTRTSGRLSTEAQARLVLDQLSLDLSSAVFRDDGNVWMAASVIDNTSGLTGSTGGTLPNSLWQAAGVNPKPVGGVSLAMNAAKLTDARFGNGGVWLRFFTNKRGGYLITNGVVDPSTISAPVAVGYQIIRRFNAPSPTNQNTGYLLHRAEVRPAAATIAGTLRPGVIESGYNITSGAYVTSTGANNGATTGDPRSIQVPGSRSNFASVIADNVIDFGVRCYVRDATQQTGLRLVFPATNANGTASNVRGATLAAKLPSSTVVDSTNYNQVFPDVVDVMVRILTDDGARIIAAYEKAGTTLTVPTGLNAQQYWWQLALANSQVFTRRVVLNAKPL